MFETFEPFTVTTQTSPEITIYGIKSGPSTSHLPPLLLLHGCPQSHHTWHLIAPHLTSAYTIIALDLRGYGASSKPASIPSYAKSAMAEDCIAVMDHLGYTTTPFYVCAHDRGARVAHKLCVDFPTRVRKAIFLDICPTLAMYRSTDFEFAKAYWHWFLLIQAAPVPETLINAAPREFMELFLGGRQGVEGFDGRNVEHWNSVLRQEDAVSAMCNDYRAGATLDLVEAEGDLREGRLMKSPLMLLWSRYGVCEKRFDALGEWRRVVDGDVEVRGRSVEAGHYLQEQAPGEVVSAIEAFFV
ncbi:Alpha/Beta hydrolase protein [Cadophora sp. MPI-SDFR-AT-0126]|nr:Alpha/Beta hydrolase protein [Leotiomycetes sp. MPI-SDFR-AT-0126]